MKKIILTLSFYLGLVLFSALPVQGQEARVAGGSARLAETGQEDCLDYRKLKLYLFLKKKNSPLTRFSDVFIEAADLWGIDWRLLPAIAGLESSFGKRMIPGTYNAYGWGGGYLSFYSWNHSINNVSRKLKENYYARGLNTPAKIGPVYAPPATSWGKRVALIMRNI